MNAVERDEAIDLALLQRVIRYAGHDLRNHLSVMQNSAYYLNMKMGDGTDKLTGDKLAKHIDILLQKISTCNRIIINLMNWAAPKAPSPSKTNVNSLARHAQEQTPTPEGVAVQTIFASDSPMVEVDVEQVGYALENLLSYQLAEMKKPGTLRVLTRTQAQKVYLEFVDSGPGLSREELDKLFEVQLSEAGYVANLGLAVARRLLAANGGLLEVESRAGIGTRFSIVFAASS